MGSYRNQVLPRIQNKVMDTNVTRAARARVCEGRQLREIPAWLRHPLDHPEVYE